MILRACLAALTLTLPCAALAYPTDDTARTAIRRLAWQHEINAGTRRGRKLPPGATWPASAVTLKMLGAKDLRIDAATPRDPKLQAGLEAIMKRSSFRGYGVALLDITHPAAPRYAAINETARLLPGSVAKILVAAGLLQGLAARFPKDIPAREAMLRDISLVADDWAFPTHHEVPVINGDKAAVRSIRRGDTFSLWEWVDHMMSPSSNAAASIVWREATLMRLLAASYPPPARDDELWRRFDKDTMTAAAYEVVDAPLRDAGIDPEDFELRLFFTKNASRYVRGGESRTSPLALLQWMLAVEQGRMVDEFSSLELKRLLYLTRRRVRYAKAPALKDHALFFKSGSFYRCVPEEGYTCTAYEGNATNILNALVEVEAQKGADPAAPTATYIVAVMSNALKKNSADDHALLAGHIHELIQIK